MVLCKRILENNLSISLKNEFTGGNLWRPCFLTGARQFWRFWLFSYKFGYFQKLSEVSYCKKCTKNVNKRSTITNISESHETDRSIMAAVLKILGLALTGNLKETRLPITFLMLFMMSAQSNLNNIACRTLNFYENMR